MSAVLWSDAHWDAAGLPKLRWFLIMAFLGAIGAALYWHRARPRLENVTFRKSGKLATNHSSSVSQ